MIKRILPAAVFACALFLTQGAHAQSYFYGYYYPDEHRFRTDRIVKTGYESYGTPMFLQGRESSTYRQPQPAVAAWPANVRVLLPNAQAKVWFEKHLTTSTGAERVFVTPPLTAGTNYSYHVSASWMEDGREVLVQRDVAVLAGRTVVVDLTSR